MTIAADFLSKLLARAQTAQGRGESPESARLLLSRAQCPALFELRDLDEVKAFRAELEVVKRKGAIHIELLPHGRSPHDVKGIGCANVGILASHLGISLRSDLVAKAREVLMPHAAELPVLQAILSRWEKGGSVRGASISGESIAAVADAAHLVVQRRGQLAEVLMRRESIRLFGDSKRIEKIEKWLDILIAGELGPSGLRSEEVLSSLGLRHEPQPFLISAPGQAIVSGQSVSLIRPYLGLPMEQVDAFELTRDTSCLLSVENKQTFHELAALAQGTRVCVIYTAGMPSPAWRRVYQRLLQALPGKATKAFHFGDIDVGGFRIALAVSEVAKQCGCALQPWLMDPATESEHGGKGKSATNGQLNQIETICGLLGWQQLGRNILERGVLIEQESISPRLPD